MDGPKTDFERLQLTRPCSSVDFFFLSGQGIPWAGLYEAAASHNSAHMVLQRRGGLPEHLLRGEPVVAVARRT